MKSLQEHLMENLNEGAQFWELNERTHAATYRFNFDKCDRITKERFDEIGMDVSTDDEEFDYVKIVMYYDDKKISLVTPVMDDPYNTGTVSYDFKVADDLVTYHDYQNKPNGLTVKDLKIPPKAKNKFGADVAEKMAWFVCYFFNNSPEPIFRIPPKGPKIYQEHLNGLLESTPKSKQKTPAAYNGRTVTYRPGLYGSEWNNHMKARNYNELYNEATFAFNYDTNTLDVECPSWRMTRMTHYNFTLKRGSFDEYNRKNMVLTPQDFDFRSYRGLDLTQMIDVLDIACWVFNNSPEPLFESKDIDEYGTVPRHLEQMGMTQEMFYDWMDGGDQYDKADEIAKHYLVRKYGNTMAKKIIKKYEMDGSNAFVGIVLEEPGYQKYIDTL